MKNKIQKLRHHIYTILEGYMNNECIIYSSNKYLFLHQ